MASKTNSEGRLAGKIALVTGSARGIGEGIARVFADSGATVVVADINEDLGRQTARDLGDPAIFLPLDVTDLDSWDNVVAEIVRRFGRLDVLVNNAGTGIVAHLDQETYEQHRKVIDVNLTGVWAGMRAVIPAMKQGGSIVNISSIDGLVGVDSMVTYTASKFAVTGMTKSLALELGDKGIRVNSIHPGMIETPLMKGPRQEVPHRVMQSISRQPIKRLGQPREIGYAALFFACDESAFCTGASLVVDGGHIAGPYRDPA